MMSWIDKRGKRYFTQEDIELANMLADQISERLIPRVETRISRIEVSRAPSGEETGFVKKFLGKDLKTLSELRRSAFRVFVFIFINGPSHFIDILKDSRIPDRTIYSALKELERASLIDKDDEDRWFIKAKGFILAT